jgi:hypothetical protein
VPVNSLVSVLEWLYSLAPKPTAVVQQPVFPAAADTDLSKDGSGMADAGESPFGGSVIWLTPEQGDRQTGPPLLAQDGLTTR